MGPLPATGSIPAEDHLCQLNSDHLVNNLSCRPTGGVL